MTVLSDLFSPKLPERTAERDNSLMAGVRTRDALVAVASHMVRQEAYMNYPELFADRPVQADTAGTAQSYAEQPAAFDYPMAAAQTSGLPDNRPAVAAQFATAEAQLVNSDPARQAMVEQALRAAEAARQEQSL